MDKINEEVKSAEKGYKLGYRQSVKITVWIRKSRKRANRGALCPEKEVSDKIKNSKGVN